MQRVLQRFWIQITADRKRFGMLMVMLGVALLMWARMIIIAQPPRTAVADDAELRSSAEDTKARPAAPAGSRASDQIIDVALFDRPERDPFRISSTHFPKPTPPVIQAREHEKSGLTPAEEARRAEEQRTAALQSMVDRLRLEAVMQGTPMAVINGRTYRIGSEVRVPGAVSAIFVIAEVRTRSVIVTSEGRQFELRMASMLDGDR